MNRRGFAGSLGNPFLGFSSARKHGGRLTPLFDDPVTVSSRELHPYFRFSSCPRRRVRDLGGIDDVDVDDYADVDVVGVGNVFVNRRVSIWCGTAEVISGAGTAKEVRSGW